MTLVQQPFSAHNYSQKVPFEKAPSQSNQPTQSNGFGRSYWGPRLWYILHKMSYAFPEKATMEQQQLYFSYYNLTRFMISCPFCSVHFKSAIQTKLLSRNLNTRQEVIDWFRDLHNDINISNSKRVYQGFEVDYLYGGSEFNHLSFHQLLDYLYNLVTYNEVDRRAFIHWVLLTYKLHPCQHCRIQGEHYFKRNDIEKLRFTDNAVLKGWVEGIKNVKL